MGNLDWVLIWIAIVITIVSGIEALFKSEFRLVRKKTYLDEFKITRLIKFADVFTLTNVIFGIISILFAVKGWFNTASIMLVLAVFSDYLDGKIAKIMQQQNEFGKELDSLADTVSFGVAPAIFGFALIQTPSAIISFTVFLFCGILRLARYNIMDLKGAFQGMPITMNGVIIPLIYFLKVPIQYYPYIYLVLGILMVSSIRIKKLP
jgi:CDP-diacylglycerol--serine O-phosphatidyltransferase